MNRRLCSRLSKRPLPRPRQQLLYKFCYGFGLPPSTLIRRLCSRRSKRTPPRPRRRWHPRDGSAGQRRALCSRVRHESHARALTRSVMDYLAQLMAAETVETLAAFRRAIHVASVQRPHHRRLLLPGPDALHDAKVASLVIFRGRDFEWWEVQEVPMRIFVVRHQVIRDDRMPSIVGCWYEAEEIYILATLIEYKKSVRTERKGRLEQS